ncbi:MAG: hypothetical protein WKG07_46930 [Hymenobacter sp.]
MHKLARIFLVRALFLARMIPEPRQQFNAAFSPARYQEMLADIDQQLPGQLEFRVAETPVFVPAILRDKLIKAVARILSECCKNQILSS